MFIRALRGPVEKRDITDFVFPGPYSLAQPLMGPLNVSEQTILSIPAAYRCVQIISDSIASLPIHAVRNGQPIEETPKILNNPDPTESRIDTISALMSSLLMNGNAYALISERDRLGFPQSIVVLAPDSVLVDQTKSGVRYRVSGKEIDSSDMFHIRSITLPGHITGVSVLEMQRRTLGLAIAGEDYAGELFTTGSIPSGVLKTEAELTKEEAEALKTNFVNNHGGRSRAPAILSSGLMYEPIGFNAQDLELLASRNFNAQAVATIFGVPGWLIGIGQGDSKTYSNAQDDSKAFVRWTLRPHIARLEAAFTALLPRGQQCRFNLDDLMKADTLTRYQAHSIALSSGFMTTEEVRKIEELSDDIETVEVPGGDVEDEE